MELTACMLDWKLRKQYSTLHPNGWKGNRKINGICLHHDGNIAKDTLRIVLSQPAPPEAFCITIVERAYLDQMETHHRWILICEDGQVTSAVNDILSCFHQFLNWRDQIRLLCGMDNDLQGLMDMTGKYLNTDLILIGQTHEILADSTHVENPQKDDLINLLHIRNPKKDELIEDLYLYDPQFDKTFQTNGLTRYQFGALHNHVIYYCNIRLESIFLARLLWLVPQEDDCNGLKQYLELTTPLISDCYRNKYAQDLQAKHSDQTGRILKPLLLGESVLDEDVEILLNKLGWTSKNRYQIILMRTAGYVHSEQTLNYYAAQLSTNFPSFLALGLGDSICCIRNLDQAERKDLRNALSFFLRENLFRAGVSNEFTDIMNCPRYRKQAEDALSLGQQENPDLWRYDFSDYLYEYAIQRLTEEYGPENLCPSVLKKIRRYDERKPTAQLEKTLRQYVACRFNASEAADQLYIHRTTFLYRMNKIEQLSGLCLQNWKDLVVLMLALSVGGQLE